MRKLIYLQSVILLIAFYSCQPDTQWEIASPDKQVSVVINNTEGHLRYDVMMDGESLLQSSQLGLLFDNEKEAKYEVIDFYEVYKDTTWTTVWGKKAQINDHYNELTLVLDVMFENASDAKMALKTRVYDDGVAFRYLSREKNDFPYETIAGDLTTFNFAGDYTLWAANRERHNLGPMKISELDDVDTEHIYSPMTLKTSSDKYITLHEAAIYDHAYFYFTKGKGPNEVGIHMDESSIKSNFKTSWRSIILGREPGDLLESSLLVNLNPPCAIEDPSWIKPGKSFWDWRVWGYTAEDGFEYGLNTVSHKRFVDFAAKNNIQYLLIDADWYGPEFSDESDPTSAKSGILIEEFMKYAKEKGVGVILYLNDIGGKKFGLERILSRFHEWGAAGVKYGFMSGEGQEKVLHTRKVVELCAKYQLMVNFHDGPVPPSGDRRTYPNLVTKEYCHAQADAKRSYYPETPVTAAFVNMVAGPLDMTNGWYELEDAVNQRVKVFEDIPGTVAAENAKTVIVFSGMTVLPDAPEAYAKKADLFEFIREQPAEFESFEVINGEIGEYITVARKTGNEWFIGSLTNREDRQLDIPLDFLEPDTKYVAKIYKDAKDSHYMDNRESYLIDEQTVDKNTVLNAWMAPGGGYSVWLKPE